MHKRRHSARQMAREAKLAREEFLENARRRSAELLDEAEATGRRAWRDAKAWAQENPVPFAASAFLAGLIVSAWLGRERRSPE